MTPPNPTARKEGEVLLALAARVEALTAPDRELDARIWCEVGNELGYDDPPQRHRLMRPLQPRICIMGRWLGSALDKYPEDIEGVAHNWRVPKFTKSLDDALTLVPKGCLHMSRTIWDAAGKTAGLARVDQYEPVDSPSMWFDGSDAIAATPAMALTAASLRARARALSPARLQEEDK